MPRNELPQMLAGVPASEPVPAKPRDRVTMAPTTGDGWCELKVWGANGEVALEVRMPKERVTTTLIDRVQEMVRGWAVGLPERYDGPRIVK